MRSITPVNSIGRITPSLSTLPFPIYRSFSSVTRNSISFQRNIIIKIQMSI